MMPQNRPPNPDEEVVILTLCLVLFLIWVLVWGVAS